MATGEVRNGFAVVRPPGHHAEDTLAMLVGGQNKGVVGVMWLWWHYVVMLEFVGYFICNKI